MTQKDIDRLKELEGKPQLAEAKRQAEAVEQMTMEGI